MMNSLRNRLLLVMVIVFVLGASNVVVYLLDLDTDIRTHVLTEQIDTMLAVAPRGDDGTDLRHLPEQFSNSDWRYTLFAADRTVLATHPAGSEPLAYNAPEAPSPAASVAVQSRLVEDGRVLVVRRTDWVDCEELCQLLRGRVAGSSAMIAILAAMSLVAMAMLSGWLLASVRRSAEIAKDIGKDHPDRRIPLDGLPTEILPLASSANDALDRLAEAYATEKRFTADAAHELRTPLAVLDLRLQKARAEAAPDWVAISEDMRQMRRLVDQLSDLARADREQSPERDVPPVSIARAVREATADMMPAYELAQRNVTLDLEEGLLIADGRGQLRQALRNLLENALRHGQGRVLIRLARTSDTLAEVEIADQGPPIPTGQGDALFGRFHKGRQQAPGSGLGLAIVRQILHNLGGEARLGTGPTFSVRLTLPLVS